MKREAVREALGALLHPEFEAEWHGAADGSAPTPMRGVAKGFDGADRRIVQEMQPGDLVVTADLPLAADVVARGGHALDPRGELYTEDNVRERLAIRNLMQELRSAGEPLAGPAPFGQSDRQRFANQLDQFLTRRREG